MAIGARIWLARRALASDLMVWLFRKASALAPMPFYVDTM